jgi:hypothetical protein
MSIIESVVNPLIRPRYMLCLNLLLVRFAYPLLYILFFVVVFFQGGRVLRDTYDIN